MQRLAHYFRISVQIRKACKNGRGTANPNKKHRSTPAIWNLGSCAYEWVSVLQYLRVEDRLTEGQVPRHSVSMSSIFHVNAADPESV